MLIGSVSGVFISSLVISGVCDPKVIKLGFTSPAIGTEAFFEASFEALFKALFEYKIGQVDPGGMGDVEVEV